MALTPRDGPHIAATAWLRVRALPTVPPSGSMLAFRGSPREAPSEPRGHYRKRQLANGLRTEATTPLKLALRRPSKKGGRLPKDVEAMRAGLTLPPPGAPIKVRTIGGREAIVLEKMQRGWFRVELDQNANDEGGAGERKSMRRPHGFAPGQDHLLDAAPQAAQPHRLPSRVVVDG